jgi:hypothetical protein
MTGRFDAALVLRGTRRRFPSHRSRALALLLSVITAAAVSGCVSTSQQTSIREPSQCGPEGCPEYTFRLEVDVPPQRGPAKGAGMVDHILEYFENDIQSAVSGLGGEMQKRGYICGLFCRQIDKLDIRIQVNISPEAQSGNEKECGSLSVTEVQSIPNSPSAAQLAGLYLSRGALLDRSLNSWDDLCAEKFPECVLGGVSVSSNAATERGLWDDKIDPNNPTMRNYSTDLLLTCVKGDERGREMEVSAHLTAYRECKELPARQCAAVVTESEQPEVLLDGADSSDGAVQLELLSIPGDAHQE